MVAFFILGCVSRGPKLSTSYKHSIPYMVDETTISKNDKVVYIPITESFNEYKNIHLNISSLNSAFIKNGWKVLTTASPASKDSKGCITVSQMTESKARFQLVMQLDNLGWNGFLLLNDLKSGRLASGIILNSNVDWEETICDFMAEINKNIIVK